MIDVDALAEHVEVEVGDQRRHLDRGRRRRRSSPVISQSIHTSLFVHDGPPYFAPCVGRPLRVDSASPHMVGGVKDWFGLVARLVTGGVWIVGGRLKLPDPADSVRAVRAYDLLPEAVVPTVGHLLPVARDRRRPVPRAGPAGARRRRGVGAALRWPSSSGSRAPGRAGCQIECGCFGGGGEIPDAAAAYPGEIARDVGLLALSLWLVVRPASRLALDNVLFRTTPEPSTELTDDHPSDHEGRSLDGAEEELAQDR